MKSNKNRNREINQYLDTAKKIYDEYTGVREVERLWYKGLFSKEGGKVIGEKYCQGQLVCKYVFQF
jgi:hypothetical protein